MLMELKDTFLDIFKGNIPLQDIYLLESILIVLSISEAIIFNSNYSFLVISYWYVCNKCNFV